MNGLPASAPPYNPEAAPFWDGAAKGRLVLPVCDACGHHIWYPRSWCPVCASESVTWTTLSGQGHVYARTVLHRGMGPWRDAVPFVVAYVELDEGPRILTNIVTDEPEQVSVGDRVQAVFVPVEPTDHSPVRAIVRFAP